MKNTALPIIPLTAKRIAVLCCHVSLPHSIILPPVVLLKTDSGALARNTVVLMMYWCNKLGGITTYITTSYHLSSII